jgi:hypothetical protein
MASTRAEKARQAAQQAGSNPYVRRFIEDEELRESVRDAFDAARHAYQRMSNGKGPVKALTDDKKVQRDLRTAAENLKEASQRFQGKRKKRHPFRKLLLISIVAAVLAIALNEGLRKAVLDRLFGAEEEFEYTSQTSAAPEAAATE